MITTKINHGQHAHLISAEVFNDILQSALAVVTGEEPPRFNPDYDKELERVIRHIQGEGA